MTKKNITKIEDGMLVNGQIHFNGNGSAFLRADILEDDLYIHKSKTNKALHLDTVEVKIKQFEETLEGEVISVIQRFKEEFVGTLQITKEYAFLIPDSNKMNVDIYIPLQKLNKARNGQKAIAKITSWDSKKKSPRGEIIEILGDADDNDTIIHAILHEYGLPYTFPKEVIDESEEIPEEITEEEIAKRRDMRNVLTFTIDPDTAKDFDDALSVEWIDGKIQVGIHIADVSHYLKEGTMLDREAYERGTSVYLVDRVVPMLPERISNGLCSLVPNEDRLCYSVVVTLNNRAIVEDTWFGRTIIHSDARLTYEEAQEMIENDGKVLEGPKTNKEIEVEMNVKALNRYAKMMRSKRLKNNSVSFDKKEIKFILDENAKPIGLKMKQMKESNQLIEEFMLLANQMVAKLLNEKGFPNVNRSHDSPSGDKLTQLANFVEPLGYELNVYNPDILKSELNKLLLAVKNTPEENIITTLVTRTMTKAFYAPKNIGHYGLGFNNYSHFTSPIRRYPDVMVHRLLTQYINTEKPSIEKLDTMCLHVSERERKAQKAERASIKYKQAEYLSERVGSIYKGVISSVMDFGVFVEMEENSCEGLVRFSEIKNDNFTVNPNKISAKSATSGRELRIGDEVTVIIKSVDMTKKEVNLSMLLL